MDSLGGCRILGTVGSGGTGTVYKADRFGERVAVKVLADRWAKDPVLASRFVEEGRIMSRLSHPGIVQVLDVGHDLGKYFLVLEYVEGPSLARCIEKRAFGHVEMARIIVAVGRALQHAHRQEVIHSDIVPSNILLKSDGRPKLTDFGIARMRGRLLEGEKAGVTAGTPVYMSPEQAAGMAEEIDMRTDVYSLGAVLYEGVTGRAPFTGVSTPEILQKVLHSPPQPPAKIEPGVVPELEKIILKAMDKDPGGRYPSMKEFADALKAWAVSASDWHSMIGS